MTLAEQIAQASANKDNPMTEPFDWAYLSHEAGSIRFMHGNPAAAAYLRERIEAAFVPVGEYRHLTSQFDAMQAFGKSNAARAEAAEARVSELTAQLAEARQAERAAMSEVNACKDALAQTAEFICIKCGRRQDGPTDNEARF